MQILITGGAFPVNLPPELTPGFGEFNHKTFLPVPTIVMCMDKKTTIRIARSSDLEPWSQMRACLWPESGSASHSTELKRLMGDQNFVGFVAEMETGKLIGFAELYVRPFANGCDHQPVPFLEGIWVIPEMRRRGVGRALVTECEAWARKNGYTEIGSDTEISNEGSIHAHRHWGFRETERVVYFNKKI